MESKRKHLQKFRKQGLFLLLTANTVVSIYFHLYARPCTVYGLYSFPLEKYAIFL